MRGRLKSRIGLAAAALIALAVAACGSDPAPAPSPAPQAPAPTRPAPPATSVPAPQPTLSATTPVVAASPSSAKLASDVENFVLEELVVAVGTEVTWTNRDAATHTSTSGSRGTSTGIWDSPVLDKGDSYSFTFSQVGTFNYFCRIHPTSMNSTVTVVPVEELASAQVSTAPSPTAEPPTATPVPPTATAVPPTATSVPPAATAVPPTATSVPPTATSVPPTATSVPPTQTPPTPAPIKPTATAVAVVEQKVASDVKNFVLEELVVAVGTELTWTNRDAATHTTTSGSQSSSTGLLWDSPVLTKGASYSFTFNEVGTFKYFCRIHPSSMNSTITVVPIDGSPTGGGGEPSPTPYTEPGY